MPAMRTTLVVLVLGSTLCACEQTDPGSARKAGGAVVGVPAEPSSEVEQVVTDNKHPESTRRATGQHIKKVQLSLDDPAPAADAAKRDAASGLPTGKRQHKPITLTQ
jgi:hypothetical protein